MISETNHSAGPEPSAPPPAAPEPSAGGHELLLAKVRRGQRAQLWLQGALFGLAAALGLAMAGPFVALASPAVGRALLFGSPLLLAAFLVAFGIVLSVLRVGDDARVARLVGRRIPELSLDALAAVELKRALGREGGFSEELARAFLRRMDERAAAVDVRRVLDGHRTRLALLALGGAVLASALALLAWPSPWVRGARAVLDWGEKSQEVAKREPITGDIELTYRYPAYTGLSPRTVPGTNGEISAPAGTEVQIRTRADREVAHAELVVNGRPVPMQIADARDLSGSFVLDRPGAYHFVFRRKPGGRVVAQGPDVSIQVEADAAPQVRLIAPVEELEIDPGEKVTLRFEASDDYGLSSLELVFRGPSDPEERRVPLRHDEGRRAKGQHTWDLTDLKLSPGQRITYYLEVRDNDAVEGRKKGVSRTQALKLYSAAEHRRDALRKAEQLWERLVTHLADRLEGPDRAARKDPQRVTAAQRTDAAAMQLAGDLITAAQEISAERDAPMELAAALVNIGQSTHAAAVVTADARRAFLRDQRTRSAELESSRRLTGVVEREISEAEKNVLYLESLIDRQKLMELRELAQELQRERRELSSLMEQYKQSPDPKLQESILREIERLRERVAELMRKMSELAKGIRDEHLNQEALKELMKERDLNGSLDEVERLLRENKVDEAMAKLQELAMQMDEMLSSLEEAEDEAGEEQYPELAKKFQEFADDLKKTTLEQKHLAEQTKEIRDRYKQQTRERVAQRGGAMKDELLRKAEEVARDYRALSADQLSSRADRPLEEVRSELENLKSALKVEDYDLAAEAAARAELAARELASYAEHQRKLDEVFQNPPEVRRESRERAERMAKDAATVEEISQKLQQLFPQPGSMIGEEDRQRLRELAGEQRKLEERAQGLQRKMDEISQMAPIFGEEAQEQMDQIGQRMAEATGRLEGRDPGRGYGEQKAAHEGLQQFQDQMQQPQRGGKGKKGGLPLPMFAGRREGWGGTTSREKVEIPDEDQFQAPKEFRKDLLEAMKQGAPERYRDQVKRYYEELVK